MLLDSVNVEFIPCFPYCPRHHCPASNSSCGSFSTSNLNKLKNSRASFEHFWSLPQHIAHTFLAKGHSHRRCPTDSDNWQQNSQWGSTDTFSRERFSLVGSILEQACRKKFLTFGGTFKVQIFFQWCRYCPAVECSILDRSFILSTTRYADFTVKTLVVFSVQFNVSCSEVLNSCNSRCHALKFSIDALQVFPSESCEQTRQKKNFLSHCIVLVSIRSLTYIIGRVSPRKIGL